HQGDVVTGRIEARDHPAEEPLDAVHARPLPAEVIADLEDVQLSRVQRCPTTRAGMPTAIAPSGTASRTTAPAPTIARSPTVTPSRSLAPAPSQAPSPMVTPLDRRACARIGCDGSEKSWSPPIT